MSPRRLHRLGTLVLCAATAAIGVALIVQASLARSGVAPTRLVLGVLFVAVAVARGYVEVRRGGRS
jgi:hypothetical protein